MITRCLLECAGTAGSQFIVTGDNHLQLGHYRGIQMVRVADFMKLLPSLVSELTFILSFRAEPAAKICSVTNTIG